MVKILYSAREKKHDEDEEEVEEVEEEEEEERENLFSERTSYIHAYPERLEGQ